MKQRKNNNEIYDDEAANNNNFAKHCLITKGNYCALKNIGNTCWMNSALQAYIVISVYHIHK